MVNFPAPLFNIAEDVFKGKARRIKVRTLLSYYGQKRRQANVVTEIRSDLEALHLLTEPDFATVDLDDSIRFVPDPKFRDFIRWVASDVRQALSALTDEPVAFYKIDIEGGGSPHPRYRLLFESFEAYDKAIAEVQKHPQATVIFAGQNARREDRDRYPFHLTVQLGERPTSEQLPRETSPDDDTPPTGDPAETVAGTVEPPQSSAGARAVQSLKDHSTALQSELLDHLKELETAIRRKVDEIRFDTVQNLAKELKTEEADRFLEEYDEEMKGRIRQYQEEIDEHQREIVSLSERIQKYEQQSDQGDYEPSDAYSTMVNTVLLFRDLCEGTRVEVLDSAIKSAARSSSRRRREVLQFLLTLRDLGTALYSGDGVGQPLKEWFLARGYSYAQKDSESTRARYGEERETLLDGVKVRMEDHVTLFPNTADCVTVYFVLDGKARKLVVGYVGTHLRTSSR